MDLTDQIVSYYKLDESGTANAADSVGSVTLTNNGPMTFAPALINNGADGGASNSTKFLANTSSAALTGAQIAAAYTMNCWINLYDVTSSKSLFFMNNSATTNRRQVNLRFNNTGDKINVSAFPASGGTTGGGDSSSSVLASTWYMISATWDGTNIRLYINATLEGTFAMTWGTGFSNTPATSILTQYEGGGNETASALVDEAGIWSRALDVSELTQLYNSGAGLQYPFTTPTSVKTVDGLARASMKTFDSLVSASVKTINGLA